MHESFLIFKCIKLRRKAQGSAQAGSYSNMQLKNAQKEVLMKSNSAIETELAREIMERVANGNVSEISHFARILRDSAQQCDVEVERIKHMLKGRRTAIEPEPPK